MTGLRPSRILWIGAAAILIAAAVIAVGAILRGTIGETEAQILGTMLALLVAGATAVTGLSLIERETAPVVGVVAIGGTILCFTTLTIAIWTGFAHDTLDWLAVAAIPTGIALLLVATQRLILRERRLLPVFYATSTVAFVSTCLTIVAIHGEDDGGDPTQKGLLQWILIFWVLTGLGYLLLPVLQRYRSAGATDAAHDRVLAALDGVELVATHSRDGIDPRLGPGERLVLRPRA